LLAWANRRTGKQQHLAELILVDEFGASLFLCLPQGGLCWQRFFLYEVQ
jgi:hypothetical protein